jgi:hypothetical protein
MKAILLILSLSSLFFISFCSDKKPLQKQTKGFSVIELFTSEGCSSCPPADKLLEEINKEYADKKVLVLAYHVDYWNRLGWQDRFSSVANTQRQNYYATIFNLSSIYTPQAVVNGSEEFVGSQKTKMVHAIETSTKANKAITLTASYTNKKIVVNYDANSKLPDEEILIALVEKDASTDVKRGENEGRKLHHVNIVRQFEHINKNKGTVQFQLPEKMKEDFFVVALIQNEKTGSISGYSWTSIN